MQDYDDLRACIVQAGLEPPDTINADGDLHRFSSNGRRGDDAGWYVVHQAYTGRRVRYFGAFGCWRSGLTATWTSAGSDLSFAERESLRAMVAEQARKRWAEKHDRDQRGRVSAIERWHAAGPAEANHPYLVEKNLPADHRLRQFGDSLLVPMYDAAGDLWNLQRIYPDGSKRYGLGRAAGLMLHLGDGDRRIHVCEGYATGRSLELCEVAAHVVVAFSAGQLAPVAKSVQAAYPLASIYIVADNDKATPGNPGVRAAQEAAGAVGGVLLVPEDGSTDSTDFNDLWRAYGFAAKSYLIERYWK
jgi:putative DNA primase/helicase